jgi:hypothetical protein
MDCTRYADSKLIPHIGGGRDAGYALALMDDLRSRITTRAPTHHGWAPTLSASGRGSVRRGHRLQHVGGARLRSAMADGRDRCADRCDRGRAEEARLLQETGGGGLMLRLPERSAASSEDTLPRTLIPFSPGKSFVSKRKYPVNPRCSASDSIIVSRASVAICTLLPLPS